MGGLTAVDPGGSVTPRRGRSSPHLARRAWWALATLPIAFVVATLLGSALISLQGRDPDADSLPLGVVLLAGIPATLVFVAPAVGAVVLGRSAMRLGERSGRAPAVTGAVIGALVIVQSVVALIVR